MRDAALIVAQNQDVTGAAVGNTLSNGSMDLGVAGTPPDAFQAIGTIIADFGRGRPIFTECRVTTAFTSANSTATVVAQVVNTDAADLTGNLTVIQETAAIIVTSLTAGVRFKLGSLPPGLTRRYLGLRLVVAVEALTAGQFWGEFTPNKIEKPI